MAELNRVIGAATAAIAAVAAFALLAAEAPAGTSIPTPAEATELGKQAYDYGFPLLDSLRIRHEETSVPCPDGKGNAPVNHFANAKKFATPTDVGVVAPNTDTLYSLSHLDLSKGPVVLKHPDLTGRFFDFELVDPYTNVIGYVGTRTTGSKAGKFAISWNDAKASKGKLARAGIPKANVIKSKYRRVWVIGRTLAGDAADQATAYDLMKRYRLQKLNGQKFKLPADCHRGKGEPSKYPTPTAGPEFISQLNQALVNNPPPKRDQPLLDQLAPLGVGPGLSPEDTGLPADVIGGLYGGVSAEAAALPTRSKLAFLQQSIAAKGWVTADPIIGDFGTDYDYRARIAIVGIGANTPEEAIYPAALADSDGNLLNGANDYAMVFPADDLPPAKYFWSLTMYDFDGYLVDNPIDRYSLGPSHPPLITQPDGSVVVAIQHDAPTDETVNWLPSPAGAFRLNMRLYGPSQAALSGAWTPPKVVKG